jgi:putative hydrolase of the HAD superfamily
MIKNIVFDLGNVLVNFDPSRIVNAVFTHKEDQDRFLAAIFHSDAWKQLDQGVMTFEAHYQNLVSDYPQFSKEIDWILNNWYKDLPNVPGMFSLVETLFNQGFDLFVLSNAMDLVYKYVKSQKEIFRFFKGATISAELKMLKPHREIYDRFCQIHSLNPGECLFIDDQLVNVQAAEKAGWHAYLFKDVPALKSFLHETINIDFH